MRGEGGVHVNGRFGPRATGAASCATTVFFASLLDEYFGPFAQLEKTILRLVQLKDLMLGKTSIDAPKNSGGQAVTNNQVYCCQ